MRALSAGDGALPHRADDVGAQHEKAEREREVRGDDGDGAAARVGRERAPGAGDAGGEDGAFGHRHLLGAHGQRGGDERGERGDGGEARAGDGRAAAAKARSCRTSESWSPMAEA